MRGVSEDGLSANRRPYQVSASGVEHDAGQVAAVSRKAGSAWGVGSGNATRRLLPGGKPSRSKVATRRYRPDAGGLLPKLNGAVFP